MNELENTRFCINMAKENFAWLRIALNYNMYDWAMIFLNQIDRWFTLIERNQNIESHNFSNVEGKQND